MPERLDITLRLHERMLDIVRTGLPRITSSMRDADLEGLAFLRGEMVGTIDAYCRHVGQLHTTALRRGDPAETAIADALAEGCAALSAAYDDFRLRWADRSAAEHWPEYRLSAIVMMKHVRNSVRRAEQLRARHHDLAAAA